MPNGENASREAAWNPSGSAARPARRRFPRWRLEPLATGKRRTLLKTLAVGLLYLFLSGLLIWVVLWLSPPQPARLVLIGAGYETNLAIPQNVPGRELLKDLEVLTRRSPLSRFWRSRRLVLAHPARTLRAKQAWDKDLASFPEKTVVICMAVHGGSDAKGAYLLPDDADTRDLEKNRLRLTEVLDRLAVRSLEKKNKVLILDATRLTAHWPLGLLENDFARELDAANDRIQSIPGLVVINASAANERSWDSSQWRRTAFGHFLVEGLKGNAARPDGRIDVRSLFEYLREQVGLWARVARGTVQTPVLYPREVGLERAAEMELAAVPLRSSLSDARTAPFVPSADLVSCWKDYDRLARQEPPPASYAPHVWSLYQATILRLEELDIAGDQGSVNRLLVRLGELERELNESRTIPLIRSQANSLVMPALSGLRLPPAPDAVEQQFNLLWGSTPEEFSRRWGQMLESLAANSTMARTTVRLQVTREILDRARAIESSGQDLDRAVALLKAIDPAGKLRPCEAHDLVMLSRAGDRPARPSESYFRGVSKAIRTRLLGESAALGVGPAGHPYCELVVPWIQAMVEQADGKRRLGQDLLFASDESSWREAGRLLDTAHEQYAEALQTAESVHNALALRDQILPVFSAYAQWVARNSPQDGRIRQNVESICDSMHLLMRQAAPPEPGAKSPSAVDLAQKTEQTRASFVRLQRAFAANCESLLGSEEPQTIVGLDDALSLPFLDLPESVKQGFSRLTQMDITQVANFPRIKLLSHLAKVDERLQARYLEVLTGVSEEGTQPASANERRARANASARCQARLAVTTLGRSWYNDGLGSDAETFDQVREHATTLDNEKDRLWLARLGEHLAAAPGGHGRRDRESGGTATSRGASSWRNRRIASSR